MNRAELYNSFPDGLKKAIRAYEPLEAKTTEQLYEMLKTLRVMFDLSPWHPLTAFIKDCARGCRIGRPITETNMWMSRNNHKADYTDKKFKWANVLVHVHFDNEVKDTYVAIWPTKKLIWSYRTECVVDYVTVRRSNLNRGCFIKLSHGWLYDKASEIIKKTDNCHKLAEIHYYVGSKETARYRQKRGRKRNRTTQEQTLTLKDILTPDPEEPKEARPEFDIMPLDTPTPMTPINTGVLEPGDSEILLTMLEMASLKLRELGMDSTLSRWRATVRRLTKNEKDTAQIETQTQTAAETD
jgi:hypothetical protein